MQSQINDNEIKLDNTIDNLDADAMSDSSDLNDATSICSDPDSPDDEHLDGLEKYVRDNGGTLENSYFIFELNDNINQSSSNMYINLLNQNDVPSNPSAVLSNLSFVNSSNYNTPTLLPISGSTDLTNQLTEPTNAFIPSLIKTRELASSSLMPNLSNCESPVNKSLNVKFANPIIISTNTEPTGVSNISQVEFLGNNVNPNNNDRGSELSTSANNNVNGITLSDNSVMKTLRPFVPRRPVTRSQGNVSTHPWVLPRII
jgi:hypothetical protein